MSQTKFLFWLIQAPSMSKHISRNRGATIKSSWKTAHDKVFFILGKKGHFLKKKMAAPLKKSYSPKYVYWYQCFSVWKMVGAKSLVHGRPAGCPSGRPASPALSPLHTHIAYACESSIDFNEINHAHMSVIPRTE